MADKEIKRKEHAEYNREWRERNKESYHRSQMEWHRKKLIEVLEAKAKTR